MVKKISKKATLGIVISILLVANLISALTVTSVKTTKLTPGSEGSLKIEVENLLDEKAEDVSLSLKLNGLPFIPVGSSADTVDEIKKNDEEFFDFVIKASSSIKPGDYEIPYTISFRYKNEIREKSGSVGVNVEGDSELFYSVSSENPVEGQEGKISLKIVNKGFGEARFVSVKAVPIGYTLLSEDEVYIGTIDSDDFESANFDVIFSGKNALLSAIVSYKNQENDDVIKNVNIPVSVYSLEKAIELGIVKKNNTLIYLLVVVVLFVVWLIYRSLKKRMKYKKSRQQQENQNKKS